LIQGASPKLLSKLKLQKDPALYHYLKQVIIE
jgi:hypothetical protein